MFKNFKNRLKSQKGMSGVLVALLLVIVGVGLVAGVQTYLAGQITAVEGATTTAVNTAAGITP